LSPEEQKYYETYFDLFMTDGWKQFIEEIEEILDRHRIEDIKNETHLAFVKGERDALFRVRRFETGIKSAYDVLQGRDNA
jgi:hypothetical protein